MSYPEARDAVTPYNIHTGIDRKYVMILDRGVLIIGKILAFTHDRHRTQYWMEFLVR